jgi:hypothetical protein
LYSLHVVANSCFERIPSRSRKEKKEELYLALLFILIGLLSKPGAFFD